MLQSLKTARASEIFREDSAVYNTKDKLRIVLETAMEDARARHLSTVNIAIYNDPTCIASTLLCSPQQHQRSCSTVSCFFSSTWQIENNGMFAPSCIGVALLVVMLELLKRLGKEYDYLILRHFQRHIASRTFSPGDACCSASPTPGRRILSFRASPLQQLTWAVMVSHLESPTSSCCSLCTLTAT
ncbi:hypothetical protein V2G26_001733 [Clonostachys chloroleuca]